MIGTESAILAAALIGIISTISAAFVSGLFNIWNSKKNVNNGSGTSYQTLTVVADIITKVTELLAELKSMRQEYSETIERMESRNKEEHVRMVKLLEQLADAIAPRTPRK